MGIVAHREIKPIVYSLPATIEEAIHTVPIDKSIPPVAIAKVTPRLIIAYGVKLCAILIMLYLLRKFGFKM
jgi:hypothetical protein